MATYFDENDTEIPLTELGPPELLMVEPVFDCNLRCRMCHVSYTDLSHQRLSPSFVEKCGGFENRWALVGSSYEPMAHPDIHEILNGLSDQGMKIDLTTNGTLLTDRRIQQMQGVNFRHVTISFDGATKETYEAIRRGAKFDDTLNRVKNFKAAVGGDCYFSVNYTVMAGNVHEIPAALDLWEEMGFDLVGFIVMVTRDPVMESESLHGRMDLLYHQMREAVARLDQGNYRICFGSSALAPSGALDGRPGVKEHSGLAVSSHPGTRLFKNPRLTFQNGPYPGHPVACRSAYKKMDVRADGNVSLCERFIIGHVDSPESLISQWLSPAAKRVREQLQRAPDVCLSCDYFKFCVRAGQVDLSDTKNFFDEKNRHLAEPKA